VGIPDAGRLNFGAELIHSKLPTSEMYITIIGTIKSPEDFYNSFKDITIFKYEETIVKMISQNNKEFGIEVDMGGGIRIIKLKDLELRWNTNDGTLGVIGKLENTINEEEVMIGICTDGGLSDKKYMELLCREKDGWHGRKISQIKWDEKYKVLKMKYGYEGQKPIKRIYFEGEESKVKLIYRDGKSEKQIECELTDNGRVEQFYYAKSERDTKSQGDVGEQWGEELLVKILKLLDNVRDRARGERRDNIADLDGIKDKMPNPVEVKILDVTEKSSGEIKRRFNDALDEAKEELLRDFKKGKYEQSTYGHIVIFLIRRNEDINNDVEITVYVAKYDRTGINDPNYEPERICLPI